MEPPNTHHSLQYRFILDIYRSISIRKRPEAPVGKGDRAPVGKGDLNLILIRNRPTY